MSDRLPVHRFTLLLLLAACLSVCATGCTLMNASQLTFLQKPFGRKKEPDFQTPRQMVPVWSDTVLHQPGEAATRGFGGRIMFYGEDKHKPIHVDGTLVVYAWDDSKGSMERTPDRKYVFPGEKLQTHYSQSRLGHSYSFWVPWDAAGGPLKHLTLISRFVSNEGTELTSSPAHVVLQGPGSTSPFPNEVADAALSAEKSGLSTRTRPRQIGGIQRVSHETTGDEEVIDETHTQDVSSENSVAGRRGRVAPRQKHPGLQTSEIGLTSGFYERNMQRARTGPDAAANVRDAEELLNETDGPLSTEPSPGVTADPASATETGVGPTAAGEVKSPRSAHFPPFESRVRASRAARPSDDHVRKAPLRAMSLNALPETPRLSPRETP